MVRRSWNPEAVPNKDCRTNSPHKDQRQPLRPPSCAVRRSVLVEKTTTLRLGDNDDETAFREGKRQFEQLMTILWCVQALRARKAQGPASGSFGGRSRPRKPAERPLAQRVWRGEANLPAGRRETSKTGSSTLTCPCSIGSVSHRTWHSKKKKKSSACLPYFSASLNSLASAWPTARLNSLASEWPTARSRRTHRRGRVLRFVLTFSIHSGASCAL